MSQICEACTMYTDEVFKTPCCKAKWCRLCLCGYRGIVRECLCNTFVNPTHFYIKIFRDDHRDISSSGEVVIVPTTRTHHHVIVQTPKGVLSPIDRLLNFRPGTLVKLNSNGGLEKFNDGEWIDELKLKWLPAT